MAQHLLQRSSKPDMLFSKKIRNMNLLLNFVNNSEYLEEGVDVEELLEAQRKEYIEGCKKLS